MIKNNFEKIEKSETVFKNSQKFGKSGAILKLNIKKVGKNGAETPKIGIKSVYMKVRKKWDSF